MQTCNQSLAVAFTKRLITWEEAVGWSSDPDELKNIVQQGCAARGPTGGPPPR